MSNLKSLLEGFFNSDCDSIDEHKNTIKKDRINKKLKKTSSLMLESVEKIKEDKKYIENIKESFQDMVRCIDFYTNDEIKDKELKFVESIDNGDFEEIKKSFVSLLESLKIASGLDVLTEDYENIENLENSLEEEDGSDLFGDESVIDGDGEPEVLDGERVVSGDHQEEQPEDTKSAYERGFNEGRKYYEEMRNEGVKPQAKARQLAETHHANKPFLEVETWMEGFHAGIKMQERVLRETKPEMFESENDE